MNVYMAGSARFAAALDQESVLPAWLGRDAQRRVPRLPLFAFGALATTILVALVAGVGNATDLVRATSGCFVAVYLLALASSVRILQGPYRATAGLALVLMAVVAVFSAGFVLVPVAAGLVLAVGHRFGRARARRGGSLRPQPEGRQSPASGSRAAEYYTG